MKFWQFFAVLLFISQSCDGKTLRFEDLTGKPINNVVVVSDKLVTTVPQVTAIMDQINNQFHPHVLPIIKGQEVSFPNRDDIRHHVYSFSKAKPFEIRLYKNTPTLPIEFGQAGIVELGCNIHDQMLGYIYVAENATLLSDENGEVVIADGFLDAEQTSVRVWHPKLSSNRVSHYTVNLNQADVEQVVALQLIESANAEQKRNSKFGKKF